MPPSDILKVEDLAKTYDDKTAFTKVSFGIAHRTIAGLTWMGCWWVSVCFASWSARRCCPGVTPSDMEV